MAIQLSNVELRRTGADGGHLYVCGIADMPEHGPSPFYAYFSSRADEREFERGFSGGDLEIEGSGVDFASGTGYAMRHIQSWRYL
jgi:hypothetical protein